MLKDKYVVTMPLCEAVIYFDNGNNGKVEHVNDMLLPTQNEYQLLLTNPRDMLHHGNRTANKGGRSV